MPKAEVGSTKYIANKMKSKGLQRLRWYCQVCGKQTRDENGFKQHAMSESHVRQMLLVGEDPKKYINNFSNQFKRDFLQLLRTSHGEKQVYINHFYQEYIRDKEHVHMNATKWPSLTEFAKYLGREGICKVDEGERGIQIQWIDDSPEAIKRREDIKRKDRQAKGDEHLESKLLAQQIQKAKEQQPGPVIPTEKAPALEDFSAPVKMSLNLGGKPALSAEPTRNSDTDVPLSTFSSQNVSVSGENASTTAALKITSNAGPKPKANGLLKKNPFAKKVDQPTNAAIPEKKMSNAERIMKAELERKRYRDDRGFDQYKRPRIG